MNAASLFLTSAGLSCLGALVSILLKRSERASVVTGCFFGTVAALFGLASAGAALFAPPVYTITPTPFSFAAFSMLFNPLSGLMLAVISLLALAAWVYGLRYFDEYMGGKGAGVMGFFMNLFIASMGFLIVCDNGFWFLVFFELMSLTSYFLVTVDQSEKSIKGGFMYIVVAHIGFMLIAIAFFVMAGYTGTFEFSAFRATPFAAPIASTVFALAFIGFGCKAGMIPFHSWLPMAHPAAPSNVSALMSGGMIKIGVFGMIKVGADLLMASGVQLWWGVMVLVFGAVSSVLGVVYALSEHDIKRLLAYHSVENIGIILIGVGVGFIGVSLDNPVIAVIGFMAGLYHLFNHAMFKGLLFLGAGSVLHATGTRNMEELGGLAHVMPVTSMCFLIGSLAISAIPPLNGFVSEWFTYQSLFDVAFVGGPVLKALVAFGAVALAITGALAVTCFVKAYGVTFLSAPRSKRAADAKEVPACMRFSMVLLAVVCVLLGIGAPWVAPVMQNIASSLLCAPAVTVATGADLVNPGMGGVVSTPLIAVLLIGFVALAVGLRAAFGKGGVASRKDPWASGYQPGAHMPVVATTFASEVQTFLGPLYHVRDAIASKKGKVLSAYQGVVRGSHVAEGIGDKYLVDTIASFTVWLSNKSRKLEGGNFRVYIVYIVVALAFFLCLAMLFKD